jgi:DNA-binding transcriptional ArsR family regulator
MNLLSHKKPIAQLFFALGDETRLLLFIQLITVGALSATTLAENVPISRQAITKHLAVLESAGLVSHQRQGREVLYEVEVQRIQEAQAFLGAISKGWDQALGRLRDLVEEPEKA